MQDSLTYDHFNLEQIAGGVYAVLAREGGAAACNAAIVDLGEQTLVVDTFLTPLAAQELRQAAESLIGNPVSYVVNTHHHPDHWLGNQVFEDAALITTHNARRGMADVAEHHPLCTGKSKQITRLIEQERDNLTDETDEGVRAEIERSISRWEYVLGAIPEMRVTYPLYTFEGSVVFYGTRRRVELISRGHAHSAGDCLVVLPADRIAILGDLAFFGCQPYLGESDAQGWQSQLDWLQQSDVRTFVPGHGPIGTKQDLARQQEYIRHLWAVVTRAVRDRESVEVVANRPLPSPLDAWSTTGLPLEVNVRVLYEQISGQQAD